jgi:O-acetyl-ADP-ribose deacetylase (regulator of RNase III)
MIVLMNGDLFLDDATVLVNPVNCVGVMGAGLAFKFRAFSKDNYRAYQKHCRDKKLRPGEVLVHKLDRERYIFNVATKDHFRDASRQEWVTDGLKAIATCARARGIKTVALPLLGSGLGRLDKEWVMSEIFDVLGPDKEICYRLYV